MKKIVSVLIACVLCLLMTGCPAKPSAYEIRQQEEQAWMQKMVTYDSFALYIIHHGYFGTSGIREWNDYTFLILSSDDLLRDSLRMDFDSDEEFVFIAKSLPENVIPKHEIIYIRVAYPWGKSFESVSCTLHYTTTDGEEVSKDYILDFTQTPFRDYRDQ